MDVGAPSNFERLHNLLGRDTLRQCIWGVSISDEVTKKRLKQTYETTSYLPCPHTAVGIEALERYRDQTNDRTPMISLATAHPAKFPDALTAANLIAPKHQTLEQLWQQETAVELIAPTLAALCEVLL